MRRLAWFQDLAALLALAVASAAPARAQESTNSPPKGPEYWVLERTKGQWEFTGSFYPAAPKAKPVKLVGTLEADFLGDSPWLVARGRGQADGEPFESASIACYDPKKARYTMTSAHTGGPPILAIDEGTYDEASRTLSWKEGNWVEPKTGEPVVWKADFIFKDANTWVQIEYFKRAGSEDFAKASEVTLRRRKMP